MKKIILSIIAVVGMVLSANAATSVWSGNFEFNSKGDSSFPDIAKEKFANLKLGDKIVVTISEITNTDGWGQINLAGKDPWTTVPGTNWGAVEVGENTYKIADAALLASIKAGGMAIQGKYFKMSDISIETEGTTPEPQPTTSVWSGNFEFNSEGDSSFPDIAKEKFANLKLGDKIVVTISEITNTDGWAQINLAGKDPWTIVPGTDWGAVKVGENKYEISDKTVLASIKAGGLAVQGKYFKMTDISIVTEEETAVIVVAAKHYQSDAVYSLSGMKVVNPRKGIFLKGGKKYIRR